MLPAKQRTLIVRLLIVGAVLGMMFTVLTFAAHVLKHRDVRVEIVAKDGAVFDGMFLAHGHPVMIFSNVPATNIMLQTRSFTFIAHPSTGAGLVTARVSLNGEFQGEAKSSEGVCGWFKPQLGQTKAYVNSID